MKKLRLALLFLLHLLPLASSLDDLVGLGTSLYFPSNTSVAILPNFVYLANATQYSFECWVDSRSSVYQPSVLAFGDPLNVEYWTVSLSSHLVFFSINGNNEIVSNVSIADGWHHVAMTVDATTNESNVYTYIDGEVFKGYDWPAEPFPDTLWFAISKYFASFAETSIEVDYSLNFKGYVDEVRIWRSVLTQEQIRAGMYSWVDDNLPDLVAQWHFDDAIDSANGFTAQSAQGLTLHLSDISNIYNDPCGKQSRPIHSSHVPLANITALLGRTGISALPPYRELGFVPSVRLPITLNSVTHFVWMVISLPHFGTLFVNGSALASLATTIRLSPAERLEYLTTNLSATTDSFNLQVTLGTTPATIQVKLRRTHVPTAQNLRITVVSGKMYRFELPVSDPDGDLLLCTVRTLPHQGTLYEAPGFEEDPLPIDSPNTTVANPGQALLFLSDGVHWGKNYATFTFSVEKPAYPSLSPVYGTITVDVVFANHFPQLNGSSNLTLPEDSGPVNITLDALDVDEDLVSAVISQLPSNGRLFVDGRPLTVLAPAVNQTDAWVASVLELSSEYISPPDWYSANQIRGPATSTTYGDSPLAWCTMGVNFDSYDPQFTYTEYIVVQFEQKLFPREMVIYEVNGPRSLVRVRTPDQFHPGEWLTIWMGTVLPVDLDGPPARSLSICGTPFPIDILRLEFDTSVYRTWFEVDAVKLIGTYDSPTDTIGPPRKLAYQPYPLHYGEDHFHFQLTDCPGQYLRSTSSMIFRINITHVNHPPVEYASPAILANQSGPVPIPLNGTDVDLDPGLFWLIVTSPQRGNLSIPAGPLTSDTMVRMNTTIFYTAGNGLSSDGAPLCGSQFTDSFVVQLFDGKNFSQPQTISIVGLICTQCPAPYVLTQQGLCETCKNGLVYDPTLIPAQCAVPKPAALSVWWIAVVASVVGALVILACIWVCWSTHRKRRLIRLKLASVPQGECTFVFTDIQNSTHLWETYAEMPEALEIHNQVIRALVEKFGGYEVKTIGDSFFVVFPNTLDAVRFAVALQLEMRRAPWPESLLSLPDCKLETILREEEPNGTHHSPENGFSNLEQPFVLWAGLRVRVGMHVGVAKIEIDPKTLHADYFGPAVNYAARVEGKALGGQILVSEHVLSRLPDEFKASMVLAEVGAFQLKGISSDQTLYSITPPELRKRDFPKDQFAFLCNRCKGPAVCPKCDVAVASEWSSSSASTVAQRITGRAASVVSRGSQLQPAITQTISMAQQRRGSWQSVVSQLMMSPGQQPQMAIAASSTASSSHATGSYGVSSTSSPQLLSHKATSFRRVAPAPMPPVIAPLPRTLASMSSAEPSPLSAMSATASPSKKSLPARHATYLADPEVISP